VTNALKRADHDYDLVVAPSGEATAQLLATALRRDGSKFDRVVVLGGDGTINGAVNGIIQSGATLPLGIIPCGTGNEMVRSLGIPKDPEKAIAVLQRGRECAIDVGVVNGRYFLHAFGLGADVQVVKMVNTLRARYRLARHRSVYFVAALALLSSGFDPFEAEIQVGDEVHRGGAIMIAAANGPMHGQRLRALPAPTLSDGLLDLYLLQDLGDRRLRRFRKTARMLRRLPVPELSMRRCDAATIRLDQKREAQVDGSLVGTNRVFTLSILPRRIRVIQPVPTALAVAGRRRGARPHTEEESANW
jgi:YegS/Rv2252/BmrU family lipid kinase